MLLQVKLSPALKNGLALAYMLLSYSFGVALLLAPFWFLNIAGVVLTTHGLVMSAAFTHELIHSNIFKTRSLNESWGKLMTHINGGCYAPWEDLVEHHFNHHVHHADFVPFDIATFVQQLPFPSKQILLVLEWLYFPAFEFVLRLRNMVAPFHTPEKHHLRLRNALIFCYRTSAITALAFVSWQIVPLYALSYICFVNVMRMADAFHHTYDYVISGEGFPKRDRVYEQANTFSNLVSYRFPWLNLLLLNFSYHNAHHHDMRCPWHELPDLHRRLYGDAAKNLLPMPQLVNNYHRFRLDRLFVNQGESGEGDRTDFLATFTGGVGVSFLTPP